MIILGINAHHADASACIVVDGKLVAAAEEERFRRVKHWAGFPSVSIEYCLREAGVALNDVDHIAVNRDPRARLVQRAKFIIAKRPSLGAISRRLRNRSKINSLGEELSEAFSVTSLKPKLHHVEHHRAHVASAFFVAPFDDAAILSVDGFGDFVSSMWASGDGNSIDVMGEIGFPHSLGIFYTAMTQYLGFPHYGDEYKVMGLAPYGEPNLLEPLREVVRIQSDGTFRLNLKYFRHHTDNVSYTWNDCTPAVGLLYRSTLIELLGPARQANEPLEQKHKDLARSVQTTYEKAFFALLHALHKKHPCDNLALAGGCAMNSVANGKVYRRSPFKKMYCPAAAGDAGVRRGGSARRLRRARRPDPGRGRRGKPGMGVPGADRGEQGAPRPPARTAPQAGHARAAGQAGTAGDAPPDQ